MTSLRSCEARKNSVKNPEEDIRARVQRAMERNRAALNRLAESELKDFRPYVQEFPDAGALYVYVLPPRRPHRSLRTKHVAPGVLLDYDATSGELIGIEVLKELAGAVLQDT